MSAKPTISAASEQPRGPRYERHAQLVASAPLDAQGQAAPPGGGDEGGGGDGPSQKETDAIGEALANPLSYLWLGFMQNDTIWYDGDVADALGEDAKVQNTFLLNPVLSVQ